MNWDALAKKRVPAPFMPKIRHELDVSNFSEEFTTMAVADSPAAVPSNAEKIFKVLYNKTEILCIKFIHSFPILKNHWMRRFRSFDATEDKFV